MTSTNDTTPTAAAGANYKLELIGDQLWLQLKLRSGSGVAVNVSTAVAGPLSRSLLTKWVSENM